MEGLKEFLESSTIHGLSHIASKRSLSRLLWLSVVITGFTMAGLLIKQSLDNWAASPVSTTTESLPISQVVFPRVTVCPPRDTFTSLTPDLLAAEQQHLDNNSRSKVLEKVPEAVHDSDFERRFTEFESFVEQDKYRLWYKGESEITYPYKSSSGSMVYYKHSTYALAGTVETPYFRQPFERSSFYRYFQYAVSIRVPDSIVNSSAIRLVLHMEYDTSEYDTLRVVGPESSQLEEGNKMFSLNVSMVDEYSYVVESVAVSFYRRIKSSELDRWERRRNTGLRLSWTFQYSDIEEAFTFYQHGAYRQFANLIHEGRDLKSLWEQVKLSRNLLFLNKHSDDFPSCGSSRVGGILKDWISLYKDVKKNYEDVSIEPLYPAIKKETLGEAARIYFYMIHCPDNIEKSLYLKKFYDDLIQQQSLKTIILTLGDIVTSRWLLYTTIETVLIMTEDYREERRYCQD